jgi:hypothetical protein
LGPKGNEVTEGWRGLRIEPLHNLYSLPSVIDLGKAGNMNEVREMRVGYRWGKKNKTKQTPWSESASELYRPSDRSLSAK